MSTVDLELQNGGIRAVLIENFAGKGIVAKAGEPVKFDPKRTSAPGETHRFNSLIEAQAFLKESGWEVVTSYIKGSKTFRDLQKGGGT